MSCKVQLANDLTPSLLPSASQETQQRNQWKNISPPCPVMPGSRLATSTEPWFVRCLGGACGRHRLCEASLLRDKAQGNVWFSHLWLRWWNAAWLLQPLALGTSQVFTLWRTGTGMNRHGCHSWDSSWGRSGPQYLKQNSPFSSRTPNTTDSIHASRWPHPSPGLLLAGHKPRSQSGAVYPQHSVRRKEEQSGIVSDPRPLARARDQLTRTKTYFDSSQPAAAAAACVCKESESEPVRAAAVLCQHHSATIWRQLAPAVR